MSQTAAGVFNELLIGADEFTSKTLSAFMERVAKDQRLFFGLEVWKRAGYIGGKHMVHRYLSEVTLHL
jgi:hypothetical protein